VQIGLPDHPGDLVGVIALAIGLAMDATAVAATRGLRARRGEAVLLAALFGGFQAGMAALGWLLGDYGGRYVAAWDHWIAFGLLAAIGGKMLWDARRGDAAPEPRSGGAVLYLGLALATSIDAGAAGITLPLLAVPPGFAVAAIGVVTALLTLIGYRAGNALGRRLGSRLEVVGGVVLIAIGVKMLVEHL
jgi:manganese efflux pump family protein